MNAEEQRDSENLYWTSTADEFYDAFGVRPPLGEWEVPVHWFKAEFGVNPETDEEFDPMTVLTALRDLRQVDTAAEAIALIDATPPQ